MKLDARQRAMLAELGVRVWQPAAAPEAAVAHVPAPAARRPEAEPPAQAPARARPPAPVAPAAGARSPAHAYRLNPPQPLYPAADAGAGAPPGAGCWLIVLDSPTPADPGAGEAGGLLHNMLRAMKLQGRPDVFVSTVERADGGGAPAPQDTLAQALSTLRPAVVLALGLAAARALLDDPAPLGPLRAAEHRLAGGTPLVVSYAPAYLLRAPQAKAAAWADLQRAMALARGAVP